MLEKFKALGLSERTLKALKKKGFEEPTQIQEETIPLLLTGDIDIVGQAQTGTGKTAAFGLPLIEMLEKGKKGVQALILVPTRELALQVSEEINSLKGEHSLKIIAIYGGQSMDQQLRRLERGVDIVVGTPGRIKDHLGRGTLNLKSVSYAILDEADEMLNMGFIDDVEEILGYTNAQRRTLLFSATMPERILQLAKRYMGKYKVIRVAKEQLTVSLTDQIYFEVAHSDKLEALCRIIDSEPKFYGLVFCRTKVDVDTVARKLGERGYDAEGLHGDLSQHQRERILGKFRQQRINVLVATDVAARGIDVSDLTHVINFALPQDPESYVHRIGRTGRAGKEGTAITFVTPDEYRKLVVIKRVAKTDIRKEKIPAVEDVIKAKKNRIKNDIQNILKSSPGEEYVDFAKEILAQNQPEEVLAAFLKQTFGDELNARSYGKIRDVSVDMKGTTRLFVARGKVDNMDARQVIEMMKAVAEIDPHKIRDVRVFDKFSFITVPFAEAEVIIRAFKQKKVSKRPIVERAKENKRTKSR
ncbi:MAG: DEAD/DEAH box helicase [Candidatus Omnitrophica bacterium]|nr:DEAD/DEAH box helicase [Candidatus Omnitrophota bacterium]